jgi:hypothetical protein
MCKDLSLNCRRSLAVLLALLTGVVAAPELGVAEAQVGRRPAGCQNQILGMSEAVSHHQPDVIVSLLIIYAQMMNRRNDESCTCKVRLIHLANLNFAHYWIYLFIYFFFLPEIYPTGEYSRKYYFKNKFYSTYFY